MQSPASFRRGTMRALLKNAAFGHARVPRKESADGDAEDLVGARRRNTSVAARVLKA